jgi:hypothetical protein
LFKKNYKEEGFYSGEEVDLTDKEYSEPTKEEEGEAEELRWNEKETSGTAETNEVSTINPPIASTLLSH